MYHEIFDQEKFRMDTMKQLPNLAWKEHKIQRSFDPFQFLSTKEHGIVWRGPVATYPPLVPREHLRATELIRRRKSLFEGQIREKWLLTKPNAMAFAASQNLLEEGRRYQIDVPVGMYNLGNTCYMTAILQCLVHCSPLQQYFLRDSAHHYKASMVYRDATADDSAQDATTKTYVDNLLVAPGNLTGVITSVGVATSIASQTGTGTKFVVDTSPTIATPTFTGNTTASTINSTTIPSSKTLVATDSTTYVVPSQSSHSGKFLTTDGTTSSWAVVDALPNQVGNAGKFLTTDGTNASFAAITTDPTPTALLFGGM